MSVTRLHIAKATQYKQSALFAMLLPLGKFGHNFTLSSIELVFRMHAVVK